MKKTLFLSLIMLFIASVNHVGAFGPIVDDDVGIAYVVDMDADMATFVLPDADLESAFTLPFEYGGVSQPLKYPFISTMELTAINSLYGLYSYLNNNSNLTFTNGNVYANCKYSNTTSPTKYNNDNEGLFRLDIGEMLSYSVAINLLSIPLEI